MSEMAAMCAEARAGAAALQAAGADGRTRALKAMAEAIRGASGAILAANAKEVETARGINNQLMQKAIWDMKKYAGKKTFIKIVDQSTAGWGHVTADNFQFDGKLLKQYSKSSVH